MIFFSDLLVWNTTKLQVQNLDIRESKQLITIQVLNSRSQEIINKALHRTCRPKNLWDQIINFKNGKWHEFVTQIQSRILNLEVRRTRDLIVYLYCKHVILQGHASTTTKLKMYPWKKVTASEKPLLDYDL